MADLMPIRDKAAEKLYMAAWYAKNRDFARAAQKAWRDSPAGAVHRFNRTLRKHGISENEWDCFWSLQSGKCAGCLTDLVIGADTHIDHCHSTGVVRGLLCSSCNLAIGKAKDSSATLHRLADYLDRSVCKASERVA